jgi:ATP-binding cassette, subfamily B, bacterial PglK
MVDRKTLKMAWQLLEPRERRNALIVLLVVVMSAIFSAVMVASIMPFLSVLADPTRIQEIKILRWLYEAGGFSNGRQFLIALGFFSIAIILFANALQVLRIFIVSRFVSMRAHTISHRLLKSYLSRPYSYFLTHHSGEMATKLLAESQQVIQQFFRPAAEVFASTLTIVALLALLLYVEFAVSLAIFAVLGVIYGGTLIISRRTVRRLGAVRSQVNTERYRIANEAIGGVRDIKLLGRERTYLKYYSEPSRRMAETLARVTTISQIPQYVMHATAFSGLVILCLVLLGEGASNGRDVIAEFLPIIGLLAFAGQRMIPELSKLFQGLTLLAYGDAAVRRVHADLVRPREEKELPLKRPRPLGLKKDLRLENVSFRYESNGKSGLEGVSIQITAGERIGVVGATGAGKSTLANLLLGLVFPTEGRILVDGIPLTIEKMRSWQATLGYVPQEIFLIDASIRENIALGVPVLDIDEARVVEASRTARVHDFVVADLPEGYETKVGERGVRLSGGQRQRIGIARALYNNADLVVFDEATSALDNVTESDVMRAIEELPWDKTLIVIAHRLSTLKNCDRIIVLNDGHIVGFAPWEILQEECEIFRGLSEI